MASDSLYLIRATRASPPGHASADDHRREVYCAALAQFDELIVSASSVGPASRPLPLFYALSQAGRAIAAANAKRAWQLSGHGLTAKELHGKPLNIKVKRKTANAKDVHLVDSVTGVADATASAVFAGDATVGELWRSLPEVYDLLPVPQREGRPPLAVASEEAHDPHLPANMRMRLDPNHFSAVVIEFDGSGEELQQTLGQHYPTAAGGQVCTVPGFDSAPKTATLFGAGYLVKWPVDSASSEVPALALERIAPEIGVRVPPRSRPGALFQPAPGFEPRWLRPAVGGVALSSLLTWWVLLFGLSMLARYEPAGWMRALDYDQSELAAPLDRLLATGIERVPELVVDALLKNEAPGK